MDDRLLPSHVDAMKKAAAQHSIQSPVVLMSKHAMWDLRLAEDRYGIYAERVALSRVMSGVRVFRGDEWWH